jgi:hypothetical protein
MICTFINPDMAKKVFNETEVHESEGFEDDLKNIAPGLDVEKFRAVLGD